MSDNYKSRAARLTRLAEEWLQLCEKTETPEDIRGARTLVGAVCQIITPSWRSGTKSVALNLKVPVPAPPSESTPPSSRMVVLRERALPAVAR